MTKRMSLYVPLLTAALLAGAVQGDGHAPDWVTMSDAEFAAAYADTAFDASLEDRQKLAWMFFVRVNQQIAGGTRVDIETGTVPLWMAWPTDPETFNGNPSFAFTETPRDDPQFVTPKDVLAGEISVTSAEGVPNSGNEETTRNQLGYDYIVNQTQTNTYDGVLAYVRAGNQVDLPVGAIETKMKWIEVTDE